MKKQGSLSCFHVNSVAYEVYYEKSGTSYLIGQFKLAMH